MSESVKTSSCSLSCYLMHQEVPNFFENEDASSDGLQEHAGQVCTIQTWGDKGHNLAPQLVVHIVQFAYIPVSLNHIKISPKWTLFSNIG